MSVRGIVKGYIECFNEDKYVTVWFIIGRNTDIVQKNKCCQVPIVKGTGL